MAAAAALLQSLVKYRSVCSLIFSLLSLSTRSLRVCCVRSMYLWTPCWNNYPSCSAAAVAALCSFYLNCAAAPLCALCVCARRRTQFNHHCSMCVCANKFNAWRLMQLNSQRTFVWRVLCLHYYMYMWR